MFNCISLPGVKHKVHYAYQSDRNVVLVDSIDDCSYCHSDLLQEVSLFIFDKKQLDGFSRHDRELILDVLKKGVSQLTRLRHPKILSVLHPLEESR